MILASGHVDTIYRLRGVDLTYRINELLVILGELEPWLLSQRGSVNAARLARPTTLCADTSYHVIAEVARRPDEPFRPLIEIERHTHGQRFSKEFTEFAWSTGGGPLEVVIDGFLAARRAEHTA